MLQSSITKARERLVALRKTIELLRADSELLAGHRESFLCDGEQILERLDELDTAMTFERRRLASDYETLISRLEADALRLREEWIGFRRTLDDCSSVHDASSAIPCATPPLLRAQALAQLLHRMESGPGRSSLGGPKP